MSTDTQSSIADTAPKGGTSKWCKATAGDIVLETYTADAIDVDADAEVERLIQLHELQLQEAARDPSQLLMGEGPDCLIGIDSEYYTDPHSGLKKILCIQLHLMGEGGETSGIFYSTAGERLPLVKSVISLLLQAIQQRIVRQWPRRVILGAFFLRADLDSIAEFHELKNRMDSAGGRICTIGQGISYSLLPRSLEQLLPAKAQNVITEEELLLTPRQTSTVVSDNGRLRLLTLLFRDMAGFAAMGTSLADVGGQIGIAKVELTEADDKARMDLLLQRDRQLFERYASTDPEITVKFMAQTMLLAKELTGSSELPPTASSLAQRTFLQTLKAAGLNREACFGVEKVKTAVWSERADRVRTVTEEVAVARREDHQTFVTKCYHGGMNMVMSAGPSDIDNWRDWDLAAAYPSAMISIRQIDFHHPRITTDVEDFMGEEPGFVHIEFEYPPTVRQPGLPVDGGTRGLLYPRQGRSYCTAAELAVAVRLGCKVAIHHGVIYPWIPLPDGGSTERVRIFEPFVRELRGRRASSVKGSAQELLLKLISNSLYGRCAMGLKAKKVYDTRSETSVRLPHSAITNEVMAAHITGNIRAVLAEIIGNLPAEKRVLSVTTDGFICNCSLDELPLDGVMAQRYMDWTERATGRREILEEKHRARQVIVMKTRGQLTAEYDPTMDLKKRTILAKVGVSPPPDVPKTSHNEYMLDLYLNRQPGQKTLIRPYISVRAQWSTDAGFLRLEREQRLNLEPDLKNRLINPRMVKVRGVEHIAFDSEPWTTAEQGLLVRSLFDGWIKKNCLKTLEDWNCWQETLQLGLARRAKRVQDRPGVGMHMTAEGAVGVLRRMFLRAWARQELGLTKTQKGPRLAAWLTHIGMPTSANDVKNSGRVTQRFEEGIVPRTAEVLDKLALLQKQFPAAALERLLVPLNQLR